MSVEERTALNNLSKQNPNALSRNFPQLEDSSLDKSHLSQLKSHFSSFSALFANTVGVTILVLPRLFYQNGIISGAVQILFIGFLTYTSASVLCEIGRQTQSRTLFEVVQKIFTHSKILPLSFYFTLLVGNIICYHTLVLKNLIPLLNFLFKFNYAKETTEFMLFSLAVTILINLLILPFLFSRKLTLVKTLTSFCSIAMLLGIFVLLLVFLFPTFFGLPEKQIEWAMIRLFRFEGLYVSIGYYLLSFCFHLTVLDVAFEIYPKTRRNTEFVIFFNCLAAVIIYLLVSFAGYFSLCNEKSANDLSNYLNFAIIEAGNKSLLLLSADFLIIMCVAFANVLNYIPLIRYLNWIFNAKPAAFSKSKLQQSEGSDSLSEFEFSGEKSRSAYKKTNRIIVWISFAVVLLIMLVITGFDVRLDVVFDFVGALFGPPIILILPAFSYLKMQKEHLIENGRKLDLVLARILIWIGFLVWLFCIYSFFKI